MNDYERSRFRDIETDLARLTSVVEQMLLYNPEHYGVYKTEELLRLLPQDSRDAE